MIIYWEVDDGYIGRSRPQTTVIPDEELEEFETDEERERYITDCIEEDFRNNISWYEIERK